MYDSAPMTGLSLGPFAHAQRAAGVTVNGCISGRKPWALSVPDSDYRLTSVAGFHEIITPDYEQATAINLYGALYPRVLDKVTREIFTRALRMRGSVEGFSLKKLWRKAKKAAKKVVPKFVRKAVKKVLDFKPVKWALKKSKEFLRWVDKATKHPAFTGIVFAITQAIPGAQAAGYAFLALQAARALLAKMSTEEGASLAEIGEGVGQMAMLTNKASGGDMFAQATVKAVEEARKHGVTPAQIDRVLEDFPDKGEAIKNAGGAIAASLGSGETDPKKILAAAADAGIQSAKGTLIRTAKEKAAPYIRQGRGAANRAAASIPADLAHLFN